MRPAEPVLAPDVRFWGSDRHSIPKNRHGCFRKRSFQFLIGSIRGNLCPAMTVFSSVPAAFFRKYRGASEPGPGEKRGSDDTPGDPPPPGRRHQARYPGYRMPPAIRIGNELPDSKRTSGTSERRQNV